MGLIDKFKNLFTEEIEVPVEEKEPIQKEVIQVEIPSPRKTRMETYEKEMPEEKPEPKEPKFPFFDDGDFEPVEVKQKPKEEKRKHQIKEVYNPPKEEKKVFRPSPIISPVYGILDKGYQKDETSKTDGRSSYYSAKEANVDAIRNKAYGGLESDLETTLFGGGRVLFDEKESVEEKIEDTKDVKDETYSFDSRVISEKPRHGSTKEDDLTDLLEEEMDKPVEEKKKKPRKISDEELFSMIDSFYEKGNK